MPRLDVRLDHDHRARLDALVQHSSLSASENIWNLIYQAHEDLPRKERQNAFQRLTSLTIETPPDHDELSRELEEAHAPATFIDSNVPIYAAGREHLCREPCIRVLAAVNDNPQAFVTDAEVFQEILHHYL